MSASADRTAAVGCATALASLPAMGPAGLVALLGAGEPAEAWARVVAGEILRPEPRRRSSDRGVRRSSWAELARRMDVAALAERCRASGIEVTWWGDARYPERLLRDPQPPGVLFWRGDLSRLDLPCVALVGTRRATPDGRATAFELGRDLAAAGICVVSGLALGIDGAAHAGALSVEGAGTVGVAASGVDTPYPPQHAALWERVAGGGAVCSETPPGVSAQAWRFPSRNRVIAGLSRLVVVVESHVRGGALLTAEAALARGVEVAAVPGPVRSPASAGTNQLLADGPAPVRHAGDVLDILGRVDDWPPADHRRRPRPPRSRAGGRAAASLPFGPSAAAEGLPADATGPVAVGVARPGAPGGSPMPAPPRAGRLEDLPPTARLVLEAVDWRSTSLNRIVEVAGLPIGQVAAILDDLEAAGLVASDGSWWRRLAAGRDPR